MVERLIHNSQDHEANPGDVIDDVRARAKRAYGFKVCTLITATHEVTNALFTSPT